MHNQLVLCVTWSREPKTRAQGNYGVLLMPALTLTTVYRMRVMLYICYAVLATRARRYGLLCTLYYTNNGV